MRIALANDHAGFALKTEIAAQLTGLGHEIVDFGAFDETACDLPDMVYPAALALSRGEVDRAMFVDGVGYGSAMIANKLPHVYAAVCQDPLCAELARSHSATNALCLGGKIIGSVLALEIVRVWITTEPLTDEKYRRRVAKVTAIAERHVGPAADGS